MPLAIPLTEGGYFRIRAEAHDADGRLAATETSFYALGPGYTAWSRYDHNRIDLVPQTENGYWENLGYDRDAWVGRSNGYSS